MFPLIEPDLFPVTPSLVSFVFPQTIKEIDHIYHKYKNDALISLARTLGKQISIERNSTACKSSEFRSSRDSSKHCSKACIEYRQP